MSSLEGLTVRQKQVLELLAQGQSCALIASNLFLSPHTVNNIVADIKAGLQIPDGYHPTRYIVGLYWKQWH